jgi:hypothetical protein
MEDELDGFDLTFSETETLAGLLTPDDEIETKTKTPEKTVKTAPVTKEVIAPIEDNEDIDDDELVDALNETTEESTEDVESDEEETSTDSFDELVNLLSTQYKIQEPLTEAQLNELSSFSGEDKLQKYLEFQEENSLSNRQEAIYKEVDNLIESLPEKMRQLIQLGLDGVDIDEAIDLVKKGNDLSKISIDDLETDSSLQRKVIINYLKSTGVDKDEIEDRLEVFEAKDLLEKKAKEYYQKNLLQVENDKKAKVEATKQQAKIQQEQLQAARLDYEKTIDSLQEIVPNLKLSAKEKTELKDSVLKVIHTKDGNFTKLQLTRKQDPKGFDLKVNYLNNLGIFNDPKAWEKIMKVGKTEQTKKVSSILKTGAAIGKSGQRKEQDLSSILKSALT